MKFQHLVVSVAFAWASLVARQSASAAEPSPAVSAQRPLGFQEAVDLAKKHNPLLSISRADVLRAEATLRQVRATALPTLTVNGSYTRLDDDREVAGRISQDKSTLAANLNLTVPVIAAARWGAWRRAGDAADLTEAQYKSAERDIAIAAARGYLTLLLQKRTLLVAEEALKTAKAHLAFSEQRYKGGVGTRIDVVRAAQEVEVSEVDFMRAKTGIIRASEALGVILGVDHAVEIDGEPVLESKSDRELTSRADLVAAKVAVYTAHRAENDAWRDYIPGVNFVFQPFVQNPPTIIVPTLGFQMQLLVSLPLYDGGLRYGQARERKALAIQAEQRLAGSIRQASADVRVASVAVDQASETLNRAKRSAALAHEAAELAKSGYSAGATSNLDLIDADRRARDADVQVALAEDALRQAKLELLSARGEFF